jgi:phage shock protein C
MAIKGRHLYRSQDALLAGVCAGIAEYLGISPTFVRVITVLLTLLTLGAPIFAYLVLMVCIPDSPASYSDYIDVEALDSSERANARDDSCPVMPTRKCRGVPSGALWEGFSRASAVGGDAPKPPDSSPDAHDAASRPSVSDKAGSATPGAGYSATYGAAYDATAHASPLNRILLVLGVLVVIVGAINLLNRLFPQVFLADWWSVLVIIAGIMLCVGTKRHPWSASRFMAGLVVIMLGTMLLSCSIGLLGWGVFFSTLSYWPVLLIMVGLLVLAPALGISGLRTVSSVLALLVMAMGAAGYYLGGMPSTLGPRDAQAEDATWQVARGNEASRSYDMDLFDSGTFSCNLSGVEAHVRGTDDSSVTCYANEELLEETQLEMTCGNRVANVQLEEHSPASVVAEADVSETVLPRRVRWKSVSVNATWCDGDIDLDGIQADSVTLAPTASSLSLHTGVPSGASTVFIQTVTSRVDILVPDGVEASVSTGDASISLQTDASFSWDDDRQCWTTSGFDAAQEQGAPCWIVTVDGCYSNCTLRQAGA